jgi:hypothetical protein
MISALPRYQHGEGLNILDAEFNDERLITELLRVQVEEYPAPQFRGMFAPQFQRIRSFDQFLVIAQPLPQLLRVAATR